MKNDSTDDRVEPPKPETRFLFEHRDGKKKYFATRDEMIAYLQEGISKNHLDAALGRCFEKNQEGSWGEIARPAL